MSDLKELIRAAVRDQIKEEIARQVREVVAEEVAGANGASHPRLHQRPVVYPSSALLRVNPDAKPVVAGAGTEIQRAWDKLRLECTRPGGPPATRTRKDYRTELEEWMVLQGKKASSASPIISRLCQLGCLVTVPTE